MQYKATCIIIEKKGNSWKSKILKLSCQLKNSLLFFPRLVWLGLYSQDQFLVLSLLRFWSTNLTSQRFCLIICKVGQTVHLLSVKPLWRKHTMSARFIAVFIFCPCLPGSQYNQTGAIYCKNCKEETAAGCTDHRATSQRWLCAFCCFCLVFITKGDSRLQTASDSCHMTWFVVCAHSPCDLNAGCISSVLL